MRVVNPLLLFAVAASVAIAGVLTPAQACATKKSSHDDSDQEVNSVGVETGIIGSDVEMTGSAIINGVVYIDGVKLPTNTKTFTSKKTGKTYFIKREKNGNVSIVEK